MNDDKNKGGENVHAFKRKPVRSLQFDCGERKIVVTLSSGRRRKSRRVDREEVLHRMRDFIDRVTYFYGGTV